MKVNSELLAAYATRHVTQTERHAVREFLIEHPAEMFTVVMIMDEQLEAEVAERAGLL